MANNTLRNPSQATIWLANIDGLPESMVEDWACQLGPAERLRYGAFLRQMRRHQFVAGRRLLRRVIAATVGVPETAINIEERAAMAPLVTLGEGRLPAPFFSISHSGSWVGCALSRHVAVGLDIERLDFQRDIDSLARQIFGDGVAEDLAVLPPTERSNRFFGMWSEKEARFKVGFPAATCYQVSHSSLAICVCSSAPLSSEPYIQPVIL